MISKEQLNEMLNAIHSQRVEWEAAVVNNLKEKANELFPFEDETLTLSLVDADDNLINATFDGIRWNAIQKWVELHCIEWNGKPCDTYQTCDILTDSDTEIVLTSIDFN